MEQLQGTTPHGWVIKFTKNIHMYTHSLTAEKGGEIYDVPCEDTPSDFVAIWLYPLNLDDSVLTELLQGLREWAEQTGMAYRLYRTRDDYQTNVDLLTPSRT
jgi:hypothetical protein